MDYYLKFITKTEASTALTVAGFTKDEAGNFLPGGRMDGDPFALDVLFGTGTIEGEPGYHVNLRIEELPLSLSPFAITPTEPECVFL